MTRYSERRSGGAGSRVQPTTDRQYKRQMDKLAALNAADSRNESDDNE
jgi:hypothetical protein